MHQKLFQSAYETAARFAGNDTARQDSQVGCGDTTANHIATRKHPDNHAVNPRSEWAYEHYNLKFELKYNGDSRQTASAKVKGYSTIAIVFIKTLVSKTPHRLRL